VLSGPLCLLREGRGGFASRVHTWVNAKCASCVGSEKRRLATGQDASQRESGCRRWAPV